MKFASNSNQFTITAPCGEGRLISDLSFGNDSESGVIAETTTPAASFTTDNVIEVKAVENGAHALPDRFQTHKSFKSRFLDPERDVIVYLPPGYDADEQKHYPVLYLHDGQNLFDPVTSYIPGQDWRFHETAKALIASLIIEPLIIVGIYNAGVDRIDEYTPTVEHRSRVGGKADLYGRLLVEELKPFIDEQYRTLTDAPNTGLGGSSLGGLVSLYLGLEYPQTFGKLAVVSPAAWWDKKMIVRYVQALKAKPELRIWLDIGTLEGRIAVRDAALLRDALITQGWTLDVDLKYLEAEGAQHSEQAWAQRVDPILRYLFPHR